MTALYSDKRKIAESFLCIISDLFMIFTALS